MELSKSPDSRSHNKSAYNLIDHYSSNLPIITKSRNRDQSGPLSKSFAGHDLKNDSRFGNNSFQSRNYQTYGDDLFKVSIQDMVRSSSKNNDSFGIPGYYVPDNSAYIDKPQTFMISKTTNKDFISSVVKQKGYLPASNQYETQLSMIWKKDWKIYKKKRTSFTDDIFKKAKETPGVGHYDIKRKDKIKGCYKSSLDKYSVMDEAAYVSKFIPFHYNIPRIELTHSKTPIVKIRKESQKEAEQLKKKWEKKNEPSPASYKVEESVNKTQLPRCNTLKISKSKILKFTEVVTKEKKYIPGVGAYNTEKSYDKISRPKGYK